MAADDHAVSAGSGPWHVAVIPDGNRRWATQHGLSVVAGSRAGVRTGLAVITWCLEVGVVHLSAFGSSRDNIQHRSPEQVVAIHAAVHALCTEAAGIPGVAVHVFGAPERLPASVPERDALVHLARIAPPTGRLVLHVGVGYSARDELAALAAAAERRGGERVAREPHRFLGSAAVPPADVVIRTGGRPRLSGFLPLQSACAELYFLPTLWPALSREEFDDVLGRYAARDRRPGE
jgi:short-chain Z-isoprenyl diphosphate synthase